MDVNNVYSELKQRNQKTYDYVVSELRQIRTGQASPSLVEDLEVTAYNGTTKLTMKELASIATEGPTSLIITPFDPSIIQDIEKAIHASPLQLSPAVDGQIIRISIPSPTQEQREKYVKLANQKVEEGKIQFRVARDDARKDIKSLLEDKAITEDDKFRAEKEIDSITKEFTDKLEELKKKKHDDIMQV